MNILLTGGGTGGHVYPALAMAEAALHRDPATRLLFVGSSHGMEAALVPAAGIPFAGLAARPPRSGAPLRLLMAVATGAASLGQAASLVARFRPDVIVATGGIAAAPAVFTGAVLRVPIVVLEGNAIPGRMNRILARLGRVVAVTSSAAAKGFPGRRTVVTGLPVRRDVYTAARDDGLRVLGLDAARRTVLVLGGSQGAARLNRAVEEAVTLLAHRRDLQVVHQVGRGWAGSTPGSPAHETGGGSLRYVRVPYLDRIGLGYACADLVVSRCGATALAEITACGKAAILVPYPYAAEDHQTHNAAPIVDSGAAVLVRDRDLSGEALAREIVSVLDAPGRLEWMAARARELGRPDAAERMLALVAAVCGRPTVAQEVRG